MEFRISRLASLCAVATLALAAVSDGSILDFKTLKIDFTDGENAKTNATWATPKHISVTKEGLGWDGDRASSRDGWIHTKPLALGLSWRPPFVVSVRVAIQPPPVEVALANGQKTTPYGGDVYVRYSPDLKHWSTWQALQHAGPQSQVEKASPGRPYAGTVRVPYRQRAEYQKLLSEYSKLDVPWKSDEEAAVRWILERQPDFFARHLPFIGYVEFLFEGSLHGGQRIRSFEAGVSYGMSGMHSPPRDESVYKDRDSSPWRFKTEDRPVLGEPEPKQPDAATNVIIPGVHVGKFALGESTLADLLGNDTPEARKRFADDGIWFQFGQGKVLTGVTIRSEKYATVEGLRIGATTDDVIAVFGQSGDATLTLKKGDRPIGELPALVYEGITFLTASGKVEAIQVTKKNQPKDDDATWSKETGGLVGRLVVAKPRISRPLQLQVGLELRSIHYGGGPWLAIQSGNPFLFEMQVTDANGKPVPPTMQRVDVIYSQKWLIIRPGDRLTVPLTIESLDGARGSHLDTTTRIWKLPPGKYRLAGTFSAPQEDRYEGKEATPWTGTLELPPVEVEILPDLPVDLDARNPSQRAVDEGQALGVLETFLGALASKDFKAAHELVAPSSKKRGDPIAYGAPVDYKAFVGELSPHVDEDTAPSGGLRKFMGYELGDRRWESGDRFRVLVTFQGWDRDEVLIVREDGKWYVADPIHIIR